jgi:hypothetical protein
MLLTQRFVALKLLFFLFFNGCFYFASLRA